MSCYTANWLYMLIILDELLYCCLNHMHAYKVMVVAHAELCWVDCCTAVAEGHTHADI